MREVALFVLGVLAVPFIGVGALLYTIFVVFKQAGEETWDRLMIFRRSGH